MPPGLPVETTMRPILAAISTLSVSEKSTKAEKQVLPFVTISREAGAGGSTLARGLVEALNRRDTGSPPWQSFDRKLVEKVAEDFKITRRLVDSLEDCSHNWLNELLEGLSEEPSRKTVFRRVAETIQGLAKVGRVVIVGRGGVFITRNRPMGIHVRLTAPIEHRIVHMAKLLDVSPDVAEKRIRDIDRNRQDFFKRYGKAAAPLTRLYTLALNTAEVGEEKAVSVLLQLIPSVNPG